MLQGVVGYLGAVPSLPVGTGEADKDSRPQSPLLGQVPVLCL